MADAPDLAGFVKEAAATLGLAIADQDFDAVLSAFGVIARVAAPVMGFPLPEDVIAASVFAADTKDPS